MGTSSKALARRLRKTALRQHGYFTAAQALDAGYADSVHLYHVKNGEWVRVFRGIYRLAEIPETPVGRGMAALLWTRDKNGRIQGVLSSETRAALDAGSLSPTRPIVVEVPPGFRRSSSPPDGIVIRIGKKNLHITSNNIDPKPAEPARDSLSGKRDAADYYDWLDYQSVLCAIHSS